YLFLRIFHLFCITPQPVALHQLPEFLLNTVQLSFSIDSFRIWETDLWKLITRSILLPMTPGNDEKNVPWNGQRRENLARANNVFGNPLTWHIRYMLAAASAFFILCLLAEPKVFINRWIL